MDEEGLTDKQKENALPLKGKVFGELPVVGEEDAIYCNLPENILNWNSSIPLCRDPLYDILYYVDENIIYAVQNGKTEAAVELSGSRLFCRGGKLYFLLNSNTKTAVKGAKSGNILCYNPVDGTVEVVLDDVFDSITVYQDLIYCRKIGEEDTGFSVDMSYWFYFFDTKELIAQKKQEKFSYTVGIARYGKDFVGKLYGLYDRSKPIEYLEELIKQGADPNFKVPIGAHLCEFDGSNSRVLEGIKELPISHYVKENNLIWLSEDGLHTWNIVTGKEEITEITASDYLENLRREQEGFIELSFDTICAYQEHAAMMHYSASKETDVSLKPEGLLLVDSGGQYYEGTTDITRTFVLGSIEEEWKKHFTLVVKSMLNLANAKFLYGCTGLNLDILARGPLWNLGIDYRCGTGHGVGYLLNVHEAPNGFRWKHVPERNDQAILEAGMVTTDEPGVYIEGSHGIRIENELICKKAEENEYGQFMNFEMLTYVPIDLDGIDKQYLNSTDIEQINRYHQMVYEKVSPYLNSEEREWLQTYTREI